MGFFKNKDDKKVSIPGFNEPEDSGVEIEGETIVLPMVVRLNEVKVNKDFEPEYSVEPVTSRKVLEGVFQIFQERMSSDTE